MELKVSNIVLEQIFAYGMQIGCRKCEEDMCIKPKNISLSEAYKRFGKTTVLKGII